MCGSLWSSLCFLVLLAPSQLPAFLVRIISGALSPLLGTSEGPAPAATATAQRPGGRAQVAEGGPAGEPPAAAPEAVQQLVGMGFSQSEAETALRLTGNDVQAAVGVLLNG